jgi:hypothetical protein
VTEKNKTYEETVLDLGKYINNTYFKHLQFDSWWYYKGKNSGVKLWEPRPDVFPDGMRITNERIGFYPLTLHNRYFAPDNEYVDRFFFVVEKDYALPIDKNMFEYIFRKAQEWGMQIYEQDWLVTVTEGMQVTQQDVFKAHMWLKAMADAASTLGVTIQYCMALPSHLLQSVEFQAVTTARASDDYNPSNDQWRIAHTSLLHWSLGIIPFKDNFFTSDMEEPGCNTNYNTCQEINSELQALVAVLSAGPVGPSDRIGFLNYSRIWHASRGDGVLLKPDHPAFPVESSFQLYSPTTYKTLIDVRSTSSSYQVGTWHYILAADLEKPFSLLPHEFPTQTKEAVIFNYYDFLRSPSNILRFDSPLVIPERAHYLPIDFNYYIVAPVLANNWTILGEYDHFITMSKQRIRDIQQDQDDLTIVFQGQIFENVNFAFLSPSNKILMQYCPVRVEGFGIISVHYASSTISCS